MQNISKLIEEILSNNGKSEGIQEEFSSPFADHYKIFVDRVIQNWDLKRHKQIRIVMVAFDKSLPILAALLGIYFARSKTAVSDQIPYWISYFVLAFFNILFNILIPDDYTRFAAEVRAIKLRALCERLASNLALFDTLPDEEHKDELITIDKISEYVPEIDTLPSNQQAIFRNCLTGNVQNSREANLEIQHLEVDMLKPALHEITEQVVSVAEFLFPGRGFTAKLYLRARKQFEGKECEILVSFSRFPLKGGDGYGTSWIKTRGNHATVWDCLEKGNYTIKELEGEYYKSVLSICLPGRIGVLAITSPNESAFQTDIDKRTVKALALVARSRVLNIISGGNVR